MYFPTQESALRAWTENFHTKISASPSTYGLVGGDAGAISTAALPWETAYDTLAAARAGGTQNPQMVVDKDVAKATMQVLLRPYAQSVRNNPNVSNASKIDVGLTIVSPPSPIPAPATVPLLNLSGPVPLTVRLQFADSATPTRRSKPFGATGMELRVALAPNPASLDDYPYRRFVTRHPFDVAFDVADKGKLATFIARWQNAKGDIGPWSTPITFAVP